MPALEDECLQGKLAAFHAKLSSLLGWAWASRTLAWLRLWKFCVCLLACLLACLWPYTVNLKWPHLKYFIKTERPRSSGSFMHAICPAHCRIGEGLLPERSVGVNPEERRRLKLTHAWQLLTMQTRAGCSQTWVPNHTQLCLSAVTLSNEHWTWFWTKWWAR